MSIAKVQHVTHGMVTSNLRKTSRRANDISCESLRNVKFCLVWEVQETQQPVTAQKQGREKQTETKLTTTLNREKRSTRTHHTIQKHQDPQELDDRTWSRHRLVMVDTVVRRFRVSSESVARRSHVPCTQTLHSTVRPQTLTCWAQMCSNEKEDGRPPTTHRTRTVHTRMPARAPLRKWLCISPFRFWTMNYPVDPHDI